MTLNRTTATALLVIATIFWGFGFIAQKNAMDHIGPLTFIGARYLLGGFAILPIAWWEYRRANKQLSTRQWALIGLLSLNFFLGSYLQQVGLLFTTVTNGGFLTGLYVFFVPLILLFIFRIKPHFVVWVCAPLAMGGLYFLSGGNFSSLNNGDFLVISSAAFWALHVLLLGYLSRDTGMPIFISCFSFLAAGLFATGGAFSFEVPTIVALSDGWIEIVYAGIVSTGIAFTLQAVGQMHVPPANAAIILSGEALFAALGGAVILGERLVPMGYFGAAMIFTAMVLVETVPYLTDRPRRA